MNIIGRAAKSEQPATLHGAQSSTPDSSCAWPLPPAMPGASPARPLTDPWGAGQEWSRLWHVPLAWCVAAAGCPPPPSFWGHQAAPQRWGTTGSPYLLLNFSGCFSRMTWKRWAMEASCRERERRGVVGAAGKQKPPSAPHRPAPG